MEGRGHRTHRTHGTHRTRALLGAVALLCLAPATVITAHAQVTAIRGTVRDSAGTPVRSAQVSVESASRVGFVDSGGHFAITGLKPGTYALVARRIGWEPRTQTVTVRDGEQVSIDFVLRRLPQALEAVVVRADTICPRFTYAGVLCRKAEGRGFMMDRDDIAAKNAHLREWIFLGVPGMTVEAVQGRIVAKSTEGWRCVRRIVNGGLRARDAPPPDVNDLTAVEVFHPEEIPPEYAHHAWGTYGTKRFPMQVRCTLIVYWTIGPDDP